MNPMNTNGGTAESRNCEAVCVMPAYICSPMTSPYIGRPNRNAVTSRENAIGMPQKTSRNSAGNISAASSGPLMPASRTPGRWVP